LKLTLKMFNVVIEVRDAAANHPTVDWAIQVKVDGHEVDSCVSRRDDLQQQKVSTMSSSRDDGVLLEGRLIFSRLVGQRQHVLFLRAAYL